MFDHFDKDHSGTIDVSELESVMTQIGTQLSPQLVTLLVAKFGTLGCSAPKSSSAELFFLTLSCCPYCSFFALRVTRGRADNHV